MSGHPREVAAAFYEALGSGDRSGLDALLDPGLRGHATEGLPGDLGGSYPDATSMRRQFWGRIAKRFDARARPAEYLALDDGRLLVRGHYVGTARESGRALDAEFMHLIRVADGRIVALDQLTDSARWCEALAGPATPPGEMSPATVAPETVAPKTVAPETVAPKTVAPETVAPETVAPKTVAPETVAPKTVAPETGAAGALDLPPLTAVRLEVDGGLGVLAINRPDARNGIDQALADDLLEAAVRCSQRDDLRALLIVGEGRAFTVGGDISVFAGLGPRELPRVLREMIGPYHQALQILTALEVPVVAAVHGAVAGGGLGLIYCADLVIAAEGTRFATGFGALGLSGDGGNSWWLPRLVGPRRAAEMYLEERVLSAEEACEWGLISRVVAPDRLTTEATAAARRLAGGPTRAYAEMRRLLQRTWSNGLAEQHALELDTIARTAGTTDAVGAIDSFVQRRKPTFEGR